MLPSMLHFIFYAFSQLQPCPGEVIIDFLAHVEDTKGNNGDKGNHDMYSVSTP